MGSTIGIVGGGYSGISVALNLYRLSKEPISIIVFESGDAFGEGPAYRTKSPSHILNVVAGEMSAFEDKPDDFVNWVKDNPHAMAYVSSEEPLEAQYLPRRLYFDYIQHLLNTTSKPSPVGTTIELCHGLVVDIEENKDVLELKTEQGAQYAVDKVVLAIGNQPPKNIFPHLKQPYYIDNPWNYDAIKAIPREGNVLIIGTMLTMIDVVLTLADQGHEGTITAVSRRGLLPHVHKKVDKPFEHSFRNLPHDLKGLTRYYREAVKDFMKEGGDWRATGRAFRPLTRVLWDSFSDKEKQRFVRHLSAIWGIHRHRIPPQIAKRLAALQSTGQFTVVGGRVVSTEEVDDGVQVLIKPRYEKSNEPLSLKVSRIINCTGPNTHYETVDSPLIKSLLQQGIITSDKNRLGLAVNHSCGVINKAGQTSEKIFTLGSPCRGLLWEITAVPDIRVQSHGLAEHLCEPRI